MRPKKASVFVEKTDIRFPAGTSERVRALADKIGGPDQVVMRALVLDGIGLADPMTAQIARLVRKTAGQLRAETAA